MKSFSGSDRCRNVPKEYGRCCPARSEIGCYVPFIRVKRETFRFRMRVSFSQNTAYFRRNVRRKALSRKIPGRKTGDLLSLSANAYNALISCSTWLVLRTAAADASNLATSSLVRSSLTIFSIPLRPITAGTPIQMSFWPYSPSR